MNNGGSHKPKYLRIKDAVHYSGLSRSLLYELLRKKKIESRLLKKKGLSRGVRIILVSSLDDFLDSLPDGFQSDETE